jgi:hypothetical protein
LATERIGTRRVPDEWYVRFHQGLAARFWRAAGETLDSLSGFNRALKPDGRLILESLTVAESFLIGGIAAHSEHELGDRRMIAVAS